MTVDDRCVLDTYANAISAEADAGFLRSEGGKE
jgi:hypothetical protein